MKVQNLYRCVSWVGGSLLSLTLGYVLRKHCWKIPKHGFRMFICFRKTNS